MSEQTSTLLILGGSYAGVSTAHYLLKHVIPKLPSPASYQVVLVSASSQGICRPGCPRAIISDDMFPQDKFFVSIPPLFEQYPAGRFRFVHAAVTELGHRSRTVSVRSMTDNTTETIPYHSLVIATGASTSSPLFGLNQSDSNELKKHWTSFRDALLQAKSIVIAGGGPTGVETASELGEHLNGAPGWFCRSTPKVSITLVASTPEILPILRPTIGRKAEDLLLKVGVKVVKGVRVADIKPLQTLEKLCSPTTVTLDDGRTLEADIYIPATGFTPNTNFIPESLLAKDKRVEVNMSTLRVDKAGERVYALGDVAGSFRPSVPNIAAGVPVLCANMKRDLLHAAGEEPAGEDLIFKEDRRETQLVPIGKSSGVGAVYGWQVPGWFVWMVKGKDYFLGMLEAYWTGKQFAKEL